MSQASITIKDGKGAEVLQQLNDAFGTLATLQSGATEPTQPVPFMLWADTTHQTLNIRHSNNSEWITLGELDTPGVFTPTVDQKTMGRKLLDTVSNILTFRQQPRDTDKPTDKTA